MVDGVYLVDEVDAETMRRAVDDGRRALHIHIYDTCTIVIYVIHTLCRIYAAEPQGGLSVLSFSVNLLSSARVLLQSVQKR